MKYFSKLFNSGQDTGFTTLNTGVIYNKIKQTSISKLTIHAEGIFKDLIFKYTEIELDNYYYIHG